MSQFKKYHPSGNLKSGIFQSLKFRILVENNPSNFSYAKFLSKYFGLFWDNYRYNILKLELRVWMNLASCGFANHSGLGRQNMGTGAHIDQSGSPMPKAASSPEAGAGWHERCQRKEALPAASSVMVGTAPAHCQPNASPASAAGAPPPRRRSCERRKAKRPFFIGHRCATRVTSLVDATSTSQCDAAAAAAMSHPTITHV